jgi:hypothetical protein
MQEGSKYAVQVRIPMFLAILSEIVFIYYIILAKRMQAKTEAVEGLGEDHFGF